jgi:succinate dehydrogenase / fumarate reductase membrane anchor subunit
MNLRSPLGRVRGLGSAKEGVAHWTQQRLTALALVPLSIWFIISVIGLAGGRYVQFQSWLSVPGNTTLILLLLFCLFHHAQLGVQVVIEDYLHVPGAKLAALILVKMTSALLGVFAAVSVLRTALLGG